MKKLKLNLEKNKVFSKSSTILLVLLLPFLITAQNFVEVSGIPGQGEFTDLQAAIDAVNPGDSIYLYPGDYGSITIDKKIHLIGTGYLKASNPSLEVNPNLLINDSKIASITVTDLADGTVIEGVYSTGNLTVTNVSNFQLIRSRFIEDMNFDNCDNLLIRNNYLDGSNDPFLITNSTNISIENNIITRTGNGGTINIAISSTGIVKNNIFTVQQCVINNSIVKNNIFLTTNSPINGTTNNIFNNVFSGSVNCAQNTCNILSSSIFVGFPNQGAYSFDSRYQLAPNSQARGAGENGIDCGVYAGDFPYLFSGIPAIPLVYDLVVPETAVGGSMNVQIKVRSQN